MKKAPSPVNPLPNHTKVLRTGVDTPLGSAGMFDTHSGMVQCANQKSSISGYTLSM